MAPQRIIAIGAVLAGVLHADTPASCELHWQLMADALLLPPVTVSLTGPTLAPQKEFFTLRQQSGSRPETLPPHLTEDPVTEFFRTGVLVGDRKDHPLKKLSVGPCEGGQLLNLRTNW